MGLEIYTGYFMEELTDWARDNGYGSRLDQSEIKDDTFCIHIDFEDGSGMVSKVSALLEEVALSQNPIIKNRGALRKNIRNMVFTPCKKDIEEIVGQYLNSSDSINLEGFVNFRMNEYRHLINLVLYMAIKKSIRN